MRAEQLWCISHSYIPSLRLQIEKCEPLHSPLKEVQIELHAFKGQVKRKIISHIVLLLSHDDLFYLCFIFQVGEKWWWNGQIGSGRSSAIESKFLKTNFSHKSIAFLKKNQLNACQVGDIYSCPLGYFAWPGCCFVLFVF